MVGALGKFEAFVENLLDGTLTRFLRGQLQPVEIAKRMSRVMESNQTVGVGHVFVPNEYRVALCPRDFHRLETIRATLERELEDYLEGVAREKGFSLVSRPLVVLAADDRLSPRQVHIQARLVDQPLVARRTEDDVSSVQPQHTQRLRLDQVRHPSAVHAHRPTLVGVAGALAGARIAVDKPVLTIGRGLDNDLVLDDQRVSRHHAELQLVGGKVRIVDLKSTNGTWVNGKRVAERVLGPGDSVSLGGLEFQFEEIE